MSNIIIAGSLYLLSMVIYIIYIFDELVESAKEEKELPLALIAILVWVLVLFWPIFMVKDLFNAIKKKKNN